MRFLGGERGLEAAPRSRSSGGGRHSAEKVMSLLAGRLEQECHLPALSRWTTPIPALTGLAGRGQKSLLRTIAPNLG